MWHYLRRERVFFSMLAISTGLGLTLSLARRSTIPVEQLRAVGDAIIGVSLIVASVMVYVSQSPGRMSRRKGVASFLRTLIFLFFAVLFLIVTAVTVPRLLYFSVCFLAAGCFLFVSDLFYHTKAETLEATILDEVTERGRQRPLAGRPSPQVTGSFLSKIEVNKGDAMLAVCDYLTTGRRLARRIVESGDFAIHVSADRPWTMVLDEYRGYGGHLCCVDCFTPFYGFAEFEEPMDGLRFHPRALRPVTIRRLHEHLRLMRRDLLAEAMCNAPWRDLDKNQKQRVKLQLVSKSAKREMDMNVKIIYDSLSAFDSIFGMDDLLRFLAHDTIKDKSIGRNTFLIAKKGVLDSPTLKAIESFCDICLDLTTEDGMIRVRVDKMRGMKPPPGFFV